MAKIFISYRREDTAEICGRIFDRLESHYGEHSVLKDVDSIPAGADFRAYLAHMVTQCDVMVVVIGPRWFGVDPYHPRLQDPSDFVRSEIEHALRRGIPIIPVLVYGVDMPTPASLPPSLAPLSYRNALWVRGDPDFRRDVDRVIFGIDAMIAATAAAKPGDTTPVDLSPQVRERLEASAASNPGATDAPVSTQPPLTPSSGAGFVAAPASPSIVPNVSPPPQPPSPFAADAADSRATRAAFGAFAPTTGAPAGWTGGGPASPTATPPMSSGAFGAPPRAGAPSVPLDAPTWPGNRPPSGPAGPVTSTSPKARSPRRAMSTALTVVALAIVVIAVAITGTAAVLAAQKNGQAAQATAMAVAARLYRVASPGDCDHSGALWQMTNAKDTCVTPGPGMALTSGPKNTEIGTADFYWHSAASLPVNARVQVTISQLSQGSCGGVLLREQAGLSGGGAGAYGFWICDDGSAKILRYDNTTGKPVKIAATQVAQQSSFTMVASAVGNTLTLTLGAVPMSVTDATYTTTRGISLGVDNTGVKTLGSAVFSNFTFTDED